jgi:hypothetical protein
MSYFRWYRDSLSGFVESGLAYFRGYFIALPILFELFDYYLYCLAVYWELMVFMWKVVMGIDQ